VVLKLLVPWWPLGGGFSTLPTGAGMAAAGEASTSEPAAKEKPIVVRVKRKPSQTRPDAFCQLSFSLPSSSPSSSSLNFVPLLFVFYIYIRAKD